MSYIKIKNNGLLHIKALTLVGASTKVHDRTKIGQFGSGNKYALAYLLRNNYEVQVYSGLDQMHIATAPLDFRGHKFHVIYINGQQTSITTDMGKDWKYWQALREIYCNALDEPKSEFDIVQEIEPMPDETHFYIKFERDGLDFIKNFDNYFAFNKTVVYESGIGKIMIRTGDSVNIYRKGIRCYEPNNQSLYDYDLEQIDVDENRIVRYTWEVEEQIWQLIFSCTNKDVLRNIFLNLDKSFYEARFSNISSIHAKRISDECKDVLTEIKFVPAEYSGMLKPDEEMMYARIPSRLYDAIKPYLKNDNLATKFKIYTDGAYREIEPDSLQQSVIDNALEFLKKVDFFIPYIINLAIFVEKDVLGTKSEEVIILSDTCLEKGITVVINTIIEEYIHIKYGVKDETRGFQDAIISEFISYMKRRNEC